MRTMFFLLLVAISVEARAESLFQDYYDQMDYLTQRDMILSQNIANADTPSYKPKELRKKAKDERSVSLNTTNPKHFSLEGGGNAEISDAEILEVKPNGNAVTLENELFKKSENSIRLQEATNMYNKSRGMLRTAIVGNK